MSVQLPEGITRTTEPMPGVRIETETCTGIILDQGAHVLSWAPTGQSDVLYTSPRTAFEPGKAVRGGIPVCWPWFNSGKDGNAPVRHGFARTSTWTLVDAVVTDQVATVTYELQGADTHGFPTDVVVRLEVSMGNDLVVQLTTTAGAEPVEFEEALHTYFAISDISAVRVDGLEGAPYVDTVGEWTNHVQQGPVTFDDQVDNLYDSDATTRIMDVDRVIEIEKYDSATTVVWNPGAELAATIADLGAEAARQYVCVETANAKEHAVTLQPGESHSMTASILSRLDG